MYEAYSDYHSMMNMAEEIVTNCALAVQGKLTIDYQVTEEALLISLIKFEIPPSIGSCVLCMEDLTHFFLL